MKVEFDIGGGEEGVKLGDVWWGGYGVMGKVDEGGRVSVGGGGGGGGDEVVYLGLGMVVGKEEVGGCSDVEVVGIDVEMEWGGWINVEIRGVEEGGEGVEVVEWGVWVEYGG